MRRGDKNHRDDIEAHLLPLHVGAACVIARGAQKMELFFGIDSTLGFTERVALARLHFDEDELPRMPYHQIDLTVAGAPPVVSRHHNASAAAEVAVRQVFADASVIRADRSGAAERRPRDRSG